MHTSWSIIIALEKRTYESVQQLAGGGGGGESVELISAGDAPLRSTAGGGKHCAAERLVLGARFILRGGARRGIVEL
jgi:hypothetical protein